MAGEIVSRNCLEFSFLHKAARSWATLGPWQLQNLKLISVQKICKTKSISKCSSASKPVLHTLWLLAFQHCLSNAACYKPFTVLGRSILSVKVGVLDKTLQFLLAVNSAGRLLIWCSEKNCSSRRSEDEAGVVDAIPSMQSGRSSQQASEGSAMCNHLHRHKQPAA